MDQDHGRSFDKPCVVLMGEFSAGKSTILNLLIGKEILPTKVTATELPPVWFSHGEPKAAWIDEAGVAHNFDPGDFSSVPAGARQLRVFAKADILRHCDIVDTPGISDPNLAHDHWGSAVSRADMVLWCTTATQAWRESERGMWTSLPERLREHSLLVVTRADKLVTETDRDKVARRLQRETSSLFAGATFVAASDAMRARAAIGTDASDALWLQSGGSALLRSLHARLEAILLTKMIRATADQVPATATAPIAKIDAATRTSTPVASTGSQGSKVVRFASAIQPQRIRPVQARRLARPALGDRVDVLSSLRRNWLSLSSSTETDDSFPLPAPNSNVDPDAPDLEASTTETSLFRNDPHHQEDEIPMEPAIKRPSTEVSEAHVADHAAPTVEIVLRDEVCLTEEDATYSFARWSHDPQKLATDDDVDPEFLLSDVTSTMQESDRGVALVLSEPNSITPDHGSEAARRTTPDAVLAWRDIVSQHEEPLSIVSISSMIEQLLTVLFDDKKSTEDSCQELAPLLRTSRTVPGMDALSLGAKENEVSSAGR